MHVKRTARGGRSGGVLKVVGIGCGAMVVLVIILGVVVRMNWRTWAGNFSKTTLTRLINETELPEDQKQALNAQIEDLAEKFKAREVTPEQLLEIAARLNEGAFFDLALLGAAHSRYIVNSPMAEPDRAEATLSYQRFARGVLEGKISRIALGQALVVVEKDGFSRRDSGEMKPELSDEELARLLSDLKDEADEAEIPMEPFVVDFSDQLREIIDGVLAGEAPEEESDAA